MIDLSILIVNYNVKEFLQNLLESLLKATADISSEIIIVDNASDDGSVETIRTKYPRVKLIANEVNQGFGVANNQALEIAKGEFILFINPDTIVKEDTITRMISFFKSNPEAGLAGCKVLNPDGSIQLACRRSFPGPWTSFTKVTGLSSLFPNSKIFARYNLTYLDENQTYEVDAVSGSFMMMRMEVYEKIGGFDSQFFMYGEDLDLCYRTQQAGYKIFYVHETEIIHYKGESTRRSSLDETKVFYEAMHLFVRKHLSSSFLVQWMLQSAIAIRRTIAFLSTNRFIFSGILLDFILFSLAIYVAEQIYHPKNWRGLPPEVKPYIYFIPSLFQIAISALSGSYRKNSLSILRLITSLFIGLVLLTSTTFFLKQYAFSRAVVLITYSLVLVSLPLWRIISKVVFKYGLSRDSRKNRTLIVGTGEKGRELYQKLRASLTNIYNLQGFISLTHIEIGKKIDTVEIVGSLENIKKIISEKKIDRVIFSTDEISFDRMFSIVSICHGENVDFLFSGSQLNYLVGKSSITRIDDIPLLKLHYNISSPTHRAAKSVFDFVLGMFTLLFIYPFIYCLVKVGKKESEFKNFILSVPEIVRGKKSFVGPPPGAEIPGLDLGKTGLTGLWYTEGAGFSKEEDLQKLNIFYARNQNIWLDVEILGKTLSVMFINAEK